MKKITISTVKPLVLVLASLLYWLVVPARADLSFSAGSSATEMANILNGPGLSVRNMQVTKGTAQQYGIVRGGKTVLGFDTGVFLNTGNVGSLQGPNNTGSYGFNTGAIYADPDLKLISKYAKYDPAIIEFDIIPQGDRANFVFSFGSEEFPEYVCSQFNDAFGLFISGPGLSSTRNAALLPGTNTPIAVNNVNGGASGVKADGAACQLGNTQYFLNNASGSTFSQLDGFTKTLTTSTTGLLPGNTYHVKLAVADAADSGYDSGAAFKWLTSTKSELVDLSLSASSNNANPTYNSEVELTWTINNTSGIATNMVQVGLDWPAGLTWLGDDSAGTYNRTTGEWNPDVIPAGGSKTLKIRALVGSASSYQMSGEITFAFNQDPDSAPFNRTINPNEDDTAVITLVTTANSPPTLPASASASSAENQTAVTTVTASDANGDKLTYSITGGSDGGKFMIDPSTGVLRFITAPDYENPTDDDKNNSYIVQVTASDGQASVTQTLTVNVTDVHENALPHIIAGSNSPKHTVNFEENGTDIVLNYDATDADGDKEGAGLVWSLAGGADRAHFTIQPDNGTLTFIATPDFEHPLDADLNNHYEVYVSVCDSEAACTTQQLTVVITNIDEDSDGDGILDSEEIRIGSNPFNDDDDGDGIPTRLEAADPNGDGKLDDARDTDHDGIPDYMDADDDGDGKLTKNEQPDPNGDGNPSDAKDMDNDGIPNYLDNDDRPSVSVTPSAFLQGAYNPSTHLMEDDLRRLGYIPKLQPYGSLLSSFGYSNSDVSSIPPFNYPGTDTATDAMLAVTGNDAPVDWVLVELRDANDPQTRIAAKAGLLQRDGNIISTSPDASRITFINVSEGNYYVAIRHRNHIGIMSANALHLSADTSVVDFTKASTPTYGSNQRLSDGITALMWGGDANNSNSAIAVGPGSDANVILGAIFVAPDNVLANTYYRLDGYYASDLNLDGFTLFSGPNNDLNVLLGNVLLHPDNTTYSSNYILAGAIPR
jgi:hypothetical protein